MTRDFDASRMDGGIDPSGLPMAPNAIAPLPRHHTPRVRSSFQTDKIDAALAAAQGEFEDIPKLRQGRVSGTNKAGSKYSYDYSYADLADVIRGTRGALTKNKIALIQIPAIEGGDIVLYTRISHAGQWYEMEYPVGGFRQLSHQKLGAALTYARRYSRCAILDVSGEDDLDGEGAASPKGEGEGAAPASKGKAAQSGRKPPIVVRPDDDEPEAPIGGAPASGQAAGVSAVNRRALPPLAGERVAERPPEHKSGEEPSGDERLGELRKYLTEESRKGPKPLTLAWDTLHGSDQAKLQSLYDELKRPPVGPKVKK
jgi:hypothetical protein